MKSFQVGDAVRTQFCPRGEIVEIVRLPMPDELQRFVRTGLLLADGIYYRLRFDPSRDLPDHLIGCHEAIPVPQRWL